MSQWYGEVRDLLYDPVFLLLGFTSFLAITGVSLLSPALPLIADSLSIAQSRIGLIVTAFTLPAIFVLPFTGFLADTFGRRSVMSTGCLLVGVGGLVGFLSTDFRLLLGSRVIQGIGYTGVMPMTVALLGDLYDGNEESEAQGLRTTFNKVGGIVWPVVGGALAAISWNFVFATYLLFIPLAGALWYGVPRLSTDDEDLSDYARSLAHIVERPRVAMYVSIGFVRFFVLYSFLTYLPLLLMARFEVGPASVGRYVAAIGVGGMITASASGLVAEKFEKTSAIIASFFVIGAIALVILETDSLILTLGAVVCYGLVDSIVGPLHKSLLTHSVDSDHRAGVVTFNSVLQSVGKTLAPLVVGTLFFLGEWIWLPVVAAMTLVSASVYFVARRALD